MSKRLEEETTYLLEMKEGPQRKITVPTKWKVTFGMVAPGKPGSSGYNDRGGLCLRLYEGTIQRACFMDVLSFRDMAIAIEELVTETKTERVRRQTPEGEKDFLIEAHVKEWRNPDQPRTPPAEFVALPPVKDSR